MEQLLFRFNPWWEEDISHNFVQRNTYLDQMEKLLKRKDIVILTGLRRIGKTTLIKLFIERCQWSFKIEPFSVVKTEPLSSVF